MANKTTIIATEIKKNSICITGITHTSIKNNTNKTVIGIPNNIDKDLILSIVQRMNASEVFLYADKYTILHTSTLMYENTLNSTFIFCLSKRLINLSTLG